MGILAAVLLVQAYRLVSSRYLFWSHLLFASILMIILANWLLLEARDPRYMLPMNAPLVYLAGVELSDLADRRRLSAPLRRASLVCVFLLQSVSMSEFARFS